MEATCKSLKLGGAFEQLNKELVGSSKTNEKNEQKTLKQNHRTNREKDENTY